MGWDFGRDDTPASIAAGFVKGWEGMACIAHAITSEDAYKVLWAVMEYTTDGEEFKTGHRWILCVLMQPGHGGWGHKSMDETSGPYYYSCPLEFLELAPAPNWSEWAAQNSAVWREGVRAYHSAAGLQPAKPKQLQQQALF